MKPTYFLSALLLVLLSAYSCKRDHSSDGGADIEAKMANEVSDMMNLQQKAVAIYQDTLQATDDSVAAFSAMAVWLDGQNGVSGAYYHDYQTIEVEYSNGLHSWVTVIPEDDQGTHLQRGGGQTNGIKKFVFNTQSRDIKNDKALIFMPYPDVFNYSSFDIQDLKDLFSAGTNPIEVDILQGKAANLASLKSFSNYGFIILDTHGEKNGFIIALADKEYKTSELWYPDDVIAKVFDKNSVRPQDIASGDIQITLFINTHSDNTVTFYFSVLVTENYVRKLPIDLSDAVLFGNHCYSGYTADGPGKNNMPDAWKSKSLAAYFGYSFDDGYSIPVDNKFCRDMENQLITSLVIDNDSTGEANLKSDGSRYFYLTENHKIVNKPRAVRMTKGKPHPKTPFYFNQFYDKDYKYENCGSFTDPRDGEEYKLACIGDQVWFAENLRWAGKGMCYDNDPGYCVNEGRLYDVWEALGKQTSANGDTIQGICPDGWHIPSKAEFEKLIAFCGGKDSALKKLRTQGFWPNASGLTNAYGFNLKSVGKGYFENGNGPFFDLTDPQASLWSSTGFLNVNDPTFGVVDQYYVMEIIDILGAGDYQLNLVNYGNDQQDQSYALRHCRCVQDQ